ncbi:HTTM domain-containing protein [Bernardetia sp. OM2101]|uniref:HTTM domain-containing protein n=1 Tax=Bernardetia sp. OM2101 TaxID=3344876 RepID=UPI0035CF7990
MRYIYNFFEKLYDKKVDPTGLALFRIIYGLILLGEVLQGFYFRILFWETNRNHFDRFDHFDHFALLSLFTIAIIAILFLIVGFKTRIATVLIYILNLFTFSITNYFEYHVDYGYTGINFMLMFMPVARVWSIDSVVNKVKQIRKGSRLTTTTVSILNNYILVGVGVGIVYLDSIFYKLVSPMWMSGLGFWKPASIIQATYLDLSFLLNNEFLSLSLGYITLCFEFVFLFFIWFRWARVPLIIIGLGLHLGILFAYPIPWFALTVASLYILLIPSSFWNKIAQKIKTKKVVLVVYYSPQLYIDNVLKTIVTSYDFFGKINFVPNLNNEPVLLEGNESLKGWKAWEEIMNTSLFLLPLRSFLLIPFFNKRIYTIYSTENKNYQLEAKSVAFFSVNTINRLKLNLIITFLIYVIFSQLLCTNQSLLLKKYYTKYNLEFPFLVTKKMDFVILANRFLFGIVPHPVFMDVHFEGYNHIVAITHVDKNGNETWLPIISKNGQASYYNTGRQWVNWTFRVNSSYVNSQALKRGIENYTYFWINKQKNISLEDATFKIKVKKVDVPANKWEKDFLKKQMAKPWLDVSDAKWKDGKFFIEVPNIESL